MIVIRKRIDHDINYIRDTWTNHYRQSPASQWVTSDSYWGHIKPYVWRLIQHNEVTVAAASDDSEHVIAWMCWKLYAGSIGIHYIYVKDAFKRRGIARKMLTFAGYTEPAPIYAGFWSEVCEVLQKSIPLFYTPSVTLQKK